MYLTKEDFASAAELLGGLVLTEKELGLLLHVHECMAAYFSARGEPLIATAVRNEAEGYRRSLEKRKERGT